MADEVLKKGFVEAKTYKMRVVAYYNRYEEVHLDKEQMEELASRFNEQQGEKWEMFYEEADDAYAIDRKGASKDSMPPYFIVGVYHRTPDGYKKLYPIGFTGAISWKILQEVSQ